MDDLKNILTDQDALRMLLAQRQENKMVGHIRARGKCPVCGKPFTEVPRLGFLCFEHKTVPARLYVDMPWKGDRIRIWSDTTGQTLDTYDRAEKIRERIRSELEDGTFDPSRYVAADASKFYAENLLDRFENDKIDAIAPAYKKDYRRMVKIAKTFFKKQDVREIRKLHLIDYMKDCQNRYSWKEKTLKNCMDLFKVFMNWVKGDLELIAVVPSFPKIEVPESRIKWVRSEDQGMLHEAVAEEDKPIIAFLMLQACRPGEARAIKCKDVDIASNSVTIHATFSGNVYLERRKGRNAKSYQIIIHPELREFVAERVRSSHPEAFLFVNVRNGRPYSANKMRRVWQRVRNATKVGDLRLYEASRHSVASQLVNAGTTLYRVSKILGHSSIKTSEKYAHPDLESMQADLSKLTLKRKGTGAVVSLQKKDDDKTL